MLKIVEKAVEEAGGTRAFARLAGVDHGHVSRALNGGSIGPALLAAAGLERIVTYRRVSP